MSILDKRIHGKRSVLLAIAVWVGLELLIYVPFAVNEIFGERGGFRDTDGVFRTWPPTDIPAALAEEETSDGFWVHIDSKLIRNQGSFEIVPDRVRVNVEHAGDGLKVLIIRKNGAGEGRFGPAGTFVHDLKAPWFVYAESEFVFWMYDGADSLVRYEVRPGSCVARDHGFTDVPDEVASRAPNALLVAPDQPIDGLNVPAGASAAPKSTCGKSR